MSFMESPIIESKYSAPPWVCHLGQAASKRLQTWEQEQAESLLSDVFGYHALQLGWPQLQALNANRMPHRWLAQPEFESEPASAAGMGMESPFHPHVHFDSRAWPWPADSLDLVVLPHALERSADPHACLREVERVLIPEGQVLITGLNPTSFWGWQLAHGQSKARNDATCQMNLIGYRRMRDWLRLLGFEVQVSRFGAWTPALDSERWMSRLDFLESCGQRWWPIFGGVYLILAAKRVPAGRRLGGRQWRTVRSPATATVPVARSDTSIGRAAASKDIC
jgi:SAM-dependent methyltransferase